MMRFICFFIFAVLIQTSMAYSATVLNFSQGKTLETAFFEYRNKIWLVVGDQPSGTQTPTNDTKTTVIVDKAQNATIIQTERRAAITIENNRVIIDAEQIMDEYYYARDNLVTSEKDGDLIINTGTNTRIINFTDQETGENLKIIPLTHNTKHIPQRISDTLFTIDRTYNGIVIFPRIQNLQITSQPTTVTIKSDYSDYIINNEQNILFPISNWKLHDGSNFYNKLILIQDHIISSASKNIQLFYRLRMVELYLAYDMPQEAAAYISAFKKITPNLNQRRIETLNTINADLGLALFLSERYRESADLLEEIDASTLNNDLQREELSFWKETAYTLMGVANTHIRFVENIHTFLPYYGEKNRFHLGIIALNLYLKNNELEKAQKTIDYLRDDNINQKSDALLIVYEARILQQTGQPNKKTIIDKYDKAITLSPAFSKPNVAARYYRLMFQYKTKSISINSTISNLQTLAREWRGDELEAAMVESLRDLYLEKNEPRRALQTMKDELFYLPKVANPIHSIGKMTSIFTSIFEANADISDVELAVIFYDFMELIPIGQKGLEIILKMADKLEGLGMVKEAIRIIENAIKFMVTDQKLESELAVKLLFLYLEKRNPETVFEFLNVHENAFVGVPKDMILKFKIDALTQMGKYTEVLTLLNDMDSDYAFNERSNMYWYMKDWSALIAQAEGILVYRVNPSQGLSPKETLQAQRGSVAYVALNEMDVFLSLYSSYINLITDPYCISWLNLLKTLVNSQKVENINSYISKALEIMSLSNKSILTNNFMRSIAEISKSSQ